jgi:hypothetical protein
MEISFFGSVLPWFRGVGVSKRRTQAGTLVLRLMGRCVGLKRPCTGPCLEGRAKKDISMLGPLGSVTNSHWALADGKERYLFKELKCYKQTWSVNLEETGNRGHQVERKKIHSGYGVQQRTDSGAEHIRNDSRRRHA